MLLAAFAFEAAAVIAGLMRVAIAVSAPVVAEAAAAATGDVAWVLRRALTVAVAELLLPPFATAGWAVLLLTGPGLEALWLRCLGGRTLDGGNGLACALVATGLCALRGIAALVLAFAATTTAALGLAHAVLHVLGRELRLPVLLAG